MDRKDTFEKQGFEAIRPKKVPEMIYEQIRDKIVSGELQPGDRLPAERELVEVFARSRPSIREALRMLETKNYITISRNKGAVVNKLTADNAVSILKNMLSLNLVTIGDVLEVRRVCEILSIKLAAQNRTDQDLERLQEILAYSHEAIENTKQFVERGMGYHVAVARASKNEVLHIVAQITSDIRYDQYLSKIESYPASESRALNEQDYQEHMDMFTAIREKDAEKAAEVNHRHIFRLLNFEQ